MLFSDKKRNFEDYIQEKVEIHQKEAKEFTESCLKRIDEKIQKEAKIDSAKLQSQIAKLSMKWIGTSSPTGDCDGKRLVEKILRENMSNPLIVAIIADSASYFETRKLKENEFGYSLLFLIELACIAGAADVTEYLLKNYTCDAANLQNAISYAASSGNEKLALKIAHISKEKGKTNNPPLLYIYAPYSLAKKVKQILQGERKEEKTISPV